MSAIKTRIEQTLIGLMQRIGVRNVAFEVTQQCNQDCAFCYNVWKCSPYPAGQMDTGKTLDLLDRIISGYRPQVITFTGGEPLLRSDLIELIRRVPKRVSVNLITNGTLMTDDLAGELMAAGVKTFEFTLLSADRDTHNALVRWDSFDSLIEAIASVRAAGGNIATTFVAMKSNIGGFEETLELNAALGVSGVLFNRFNIGGAGIEAAAELMPSVEELQQALSIANENAAKYGISISCGVPIPQCVIDWSPYPNIHFTDCAVGTRSAYPTVDALGNVRPCNHSANILGNLFESDFGSIIASDRALAYAEGVPEKCEDCKHVKKCRGGCRAAAEVCGKQCGTDPFVEMCEGRGEACVTCI